MRSISTCPRFWVRIYGHRTSDQLTGSVCWRRLGFSRVCNEASYAKSTHSPTLHMPSLSQHEGLCSPVRSAYQDPNCSSRGMLLRGSVKLTSCAEEGHPSTQPGIASDTGSWPTPSWSLILQMISTVRLSSTRASDIPRACYFWLFKAGFQFSSEIVSWYRSSYCTDLERF